MVYLSVICLQSLRSSPTQSKPALERSLLLAGFVSMQNVELVDGIALADVYRGITPRVVGSAKGPLLKPIAVGYQTFHAPRYRKASMSLVVLGHRAHCFCLTKDTFSMQTCCCASSITFHDYVLELWSKIPNILVSKTFSASLACIGGLS